MDIKPWLERADRVRAEGDYSHAELARDLARHLTWHGALDVATALRSFVYGQPGSSDLHKAVEPLYRRLGWEQSALVACWFRDARNRPDTRPQQRPSHRRLGGWPAAANPQAPNTAA
jgi:hypothetical protein